MAYVNLRFPYHFLDLNVHIQLIRSQLWDVCSDQEAVDLVRHTQDPQLASKQLVDHALARFSTDNLSCMIVRFNNRAVQDTLERRTEPIGVEGDPGSSVPGAIRETEAIVGAAKVRSRGMAGVEEEAGGHEEVIMEEPGMEGRHEPEPRLDGGVLAKKRSKAMEGQRASSEAAERR